MKQLLCILPALVLFGVTITLICLGKDTASASAQLFLLAAVLGAGGPGIADRIKRRRDNGENERDS